MNVAIPIDEADGQFSDLIERVRRGETFTILIEGQPVAEITPAELPPVQHRLPGSAEGQFTVPDSFFDPFPDDILSAHG